MGSSQVSRTLSCPSWCTVRHRADRGEEDLVHVSGALVVRRTLLRLAMTVDPDTGQPDGPYVLVGSDEYSLHEADVLIAALTQLVDEAREEVTAPAVPRMRTHGP